MTKAQFIKATVMALTMRHGMLYASRRKSSNAEEKSDASNK